MIQLWPEQRNYRFPITRVTVKTAKKSFRATIFEQVQKRFDNNSATKADVLMFALFEETKAQREQICALNLKISMLEMMDDSACIPPELNAIMYSKRPEGHVA